ncbi:hypothetical protein [Exiguobacterium acetylicum]|uniref:hypothetical protein n=1 Tax=Exiguobacterium acetylicum TaxID=41170 RepID=UPI0018D1AF6D|nr:hypothetical protein [Exiguobacterium acetylicum]
MDEDGGTAQDMPTKIDVASDYLDRDQELLELWNRRPHLTDSGRRCSRSDSPN